MQVLAQITLNFQQPNFVTVYAAQNDRLSRYINAQLLDGSAPWTLPTGGLMTIRYRKPDGTSGFYDTLEDGSPAYNVETDGSITFGLAEQALTVPGAVPVELNFYNAAGSKLSTLTFIVAVKPSAYSDEDIASSDYYNILTAKMQQLAELADSAEGDYQDYLSALSAFVGAPRTAPTAADMLDTNLVYVYTGSETGYTYGDWYYYNGREWTSGGVYNSAAISLDDTLTNANKPAQAKAAGDLVLVQDTQPAATVNKLWFPLTEPTDEQIPTWDEFSDLKSALSDVESASNKLQLQITPQIIPNKYINNGAFVTYNTWSATDYIEVPDSVEEITITTERASVYNAWYDNTKAYMPEESLTLSLGTNVLTRPAGARYFALSNTTEAMTSTSVFFKVSVKSYVDDQITESNNYTDTEVETVRQSIPTSTQNQQYYNLLENHRDSLVVDQFVLDNGELWPNDNYISLSDYIECEPSTDYGFAFTDQTNNNPVPRIAWYKSDKTHIETIYHANNTAYTSPSNAYFFRISCIKLKESHTTGHSDFSLAYFAKCDIPYGPPAIDMEYVFDDKYPNSSLRDKTWAAFGDSITEKNVRTTINYHDYIRAETGITVINNGVGGSGYKCRWQNDNNIPALADAFDFTGVDIVTCMAGINDAWTDLTDNMGNVDDVYDTSATAQNQSVMACFNHFLDIVIEKAPFAKIGIISPIPCYHTQSGTLYDFNPANDSSTLAQFVEKCKISCKHHGIPYLDLFHNSGLRPWDSTVNDAMFKCNAADSPDGLHPNYLGHKYFYPLVREFIKQLG